MIALAALLLPGGAVFGQDADRPIGTTLCARVVQADVVALDQPWFWNRLGAVEPQGMMFALKRDVVPSSTSPVDALVAGHVQLRSDKRPRPLALRMNVGDCLQINFTNLLSPTTVDKEQPATRTASVHVVGMQLVDSIASDGSNVGKNLSSLVKPGGSAVYKLFAEREGGYFLYSAAATTGGEGNGGSLAAGLFGVVVVQPKGAEWYRSQVTQDDLKYATIGTTADGHPLLDYQAIYPAGHKFAGLPVLNMLQRGKIVHSDLTALITGPNAGRFPPGTYRVNAVQPDRDQPFREFALIYHDEIGAVQAFPEFQDPQLKYTLHGVRDAFAIKFKLTDPATGKALENLTDVRIVAFLAPGVWQRREMATASGNGIYTMTATAPETGIYYVFVECPSLGLLLNEQRPVILQAVGAEVVKESP